MNTLSEVASEGTDLTVLSPILLQIFGNLNLSIQCNSRQAICSGESNFGNQYSFEQPVTHYGLKMKGLMTSYVTLITLLQGEIGLRDEFLAQLCQFASIQELEGNGETLITTSSVMACQTLVDFVL